MGIAVKIPLDLDNIIRRLPVKEKIRLAQELEKQTRRRRWTPLLNRLRKRAAKNPISEKEIAALVKEAAR